MKKLTLIIPLFILLLFLAGIFSLFQPADKNDSTAVIFVVGKGEGINSIAQRLEAQKLIRNRFVFIFEVRRLGLGPKIQTGDFRLYKSRTPSQIARELTTGTLDVWVTIIEGWRTEEIAELLKDKFPTYDNSWVLELRKHEGYLFPDTYLIPKDADIELIVKILRENFDRKLNSLNVDYTKNGLSLENSIILASIVEREARSDEVRKQVAGILLKRLSIVMKLDTDATVQYALGFQATQKGWWKKGLTFDDLEIRSPYNTYRNAGLPPGPISNPGLSSLQAVFTASSSTPYLYYLHDNLGNSYYAKTLEEHNLNKTKYLNY
ncbi:endolytic transglycosylase MltG [Candidatus Microgenomates bacterium]|nr:endolytic transglycosylase MltG [Candidatus Microgenomates bacterium]